MRCAHTDDKEKIKREKNIKLKIAFIFFVIFFFSLLRLSSIKTYAMANGNRSIAPRYSDILNVA